MPFIGTNIPNQHVSNIYIKLRYRAPGPAQKLKIKIHLTKSPKRVHINKFSLYMLEEHYYLILTS